ncbi:hypothetical protein Csa_022308 [Cucumis sativus]|uniref:Uncharacterized protein n=1 Tax=Cucumis sativus TaxID=3659 RepID=A0A0A0LNI9_CUCSA|nr:hypothetical protein Csa_022308 [Cucumis sativus]
MYEESELEERDRSDLEADGVKCVERTPINGKLVVDKRREKYRWRKRENRWVRDFGRVELRRDRRARERW